MDVEFTPVIRARVPADWSTKESHTFLASDGHANVIASSEPLSSGIDAYKYATVQGNLLQQQFPGFEEHEYGPQLVFGGRPGYLRQFSWIPENGESVTQIQIYYVSGARGFTATATTTSARFERIGGELRAILGALDLEA